MFAPGKSIGVISNPLLSKFHQMNFHHEMFLNHELRDQGILKKLNIDVMKVGI